MTVGRRLSEYELGRSLANVFAYVEDSLIHDLHTFSMHLDRYKHDPKLGSVASRISHALRDAHLAIKNASDSISPETRRLIEAR